MRRRWALLPRWARWTLAVYLIGFAEGTGDHVRWMTRGGIWLAVAVMALDVAANWAGNWSAMPRFLLQSLSIELFAVFVFVTALPLLRAVASAQAPAGAPGEALG